MAGAAPRNDAVLHQLPARLFLAAAATTSIATQRRVFPWKLEKGTCRVTSKVSRREGIFLYLVELRVKSNPMDEGLWYPEVDSCRERWASYWEAESRDLSRDLLNSHVSPSALSGCSGSQVHGLNPIGIAALLL